MSAPRRKLIEVALPLESINRACEEDKDRKTGHIRNLHKWFAPMPLPAWRAALFASLVDDPSNDLPEQEAKQEREKLFDLIRRLVPFEAMRDQGALREANAAIRQSTQGNPPIIVDPFCGGGSTVIEAQRLGLQSIASDLNPIPVLITLMLGTVPPLFQNKAPANPNDRGNKLTSWRGIRGFVADVQHYAKWIRDEARKQIGHLYPPASNSETVIAWRWATTVATPDPAYQGAQTPLVSDWWLSKRKNKSAWISPAVDKPNRKINFEIRSEGEPPPGTTSRTGARCLYSGTPISLSYIRSEGKAGRLGLRLLATVTSSDNGPHYLCPDTEQEQIATSAQPTWRPEGELPARALGFRIQEYGLTEYAQLFTRRQTCALSTFAALVAKSRERVLADALAAGFSSDERRLHDGGTGAAAYADAVTTMLGICIGKLAQANNILVRWFIDPRNGSSKAVQAFDRHAVPMVWDFAETNPFGGSVGDWISSVVSTGLRALDLVEPTGPPVRTYQVDARALASIVSGNAMVATDPPYYGNIGYADLSDFFYVWLRPALRSVHPSLFATLLTPKTNELIATPFRHGGDKTAAEQYFREGFTEVFSNLAKLNRPDVPLTVVYAFKQQETREADTASTGWETMLDGLLAANLGIVGTWPIRTARAARMIGVGTNALASAILIVCRPRSKDSPLATRREFVTALQRELPTSVRNLQLGNIAPVDLAQAAIGPGMAIFSRYLRVVEANGEAMSVRAALAQINQVLDECLAEQENEFDTNTRWALAWFEQFGMDEASFGTAETLSKAKNTAVNALVESGILAAKAGKVRLLKRNEMGPRWDLAADRRLTVWEVTQHLIRTLEEEGEVGAAALHRRLGSLAEVARDLAYRLYSICERNKWAQEALAYNGLVTAWPEIARLAQSPEPSAQVKLNL